MNTNALYHGDNLEILREQIKMNDLSGNIAW